MSLLNGFRVVQLGPGLAAAVCCRLLADVGAEVICVDADNATPLAAYLNHGKSAGTRGAIASANLVVCEGLDCEPAGNAALVDISPFGRSGPKANAPASDLTLMYSSGIARLLTGQVDDIDEAPIRPVGEQSAFIGGLAAACAGMHAAQPHMTGAVIDVSIEEALATMAMAELTPAGMHGRSRSRKRLTDGNGATVCILPARDGYMAISPREDRQWAAWLEAMGSPSWGSEQRFATKADRVANWDALHALMSDWSRQHDKQWIADTAQAAHVPSFPLRELPEHFDSPQLVASRLLAKLERQAGARFAVRPRHRTGREIGVTRAIAAVGHSRAGLQLGHRGANNDALPRRDGRGSDQGRGARPRRSGPRIRTAHCVGPGKARHSAGPEAA